MIERIDPPFAGPEREMLHAWLRFQRDTLAWKCEGLDDDQLRTLSVPPSTLSLLGLVRHMADVERSWFRRVLRDEDAPPLFYSKERHDDDFDNLGSATTEEVFATWRAECAVADANIARTSSLDDLAARVTPDHISLRWILVHMIEEYSRHNGHADLLRQCIDGAVGE